MDPSKARHCARPGCGHSIGDHSGADNFGNGFCMSGQHGAARGCRCDSYIPSEADNARAKMLDLGKAWPSSALMALKRARAFLHEEHSKLNPIRFPVNPTDCECCNELNTVIEQGEWLLKLQRAFSFA